MTMARILAAILACAVLSGCYETGYEREKRIELEKRVERRLDRLERLQDRAQTKD